MLKWGEKNVTWRGKEIVEGERAIHQKERCYSKEKILQEEG